MAGRIDRDLDRAIAQGSAVYAQQLAEELTGAEERFSPRFEAAMEGMIARQSAAKAAGGVKRQLRAAAVVQLMKPEEVVAQLVEPGAEQQRGPCGTAAA